MKRILIVRLSAIGDVVMASPMAAAFKNTYGGSHVTWLVEDSAAEILRGNPHIDEIIIWPRSRWKELWKARSIPSLLKEVSTMVRILRQKPGYDLAVDIQGLLKSGIWTFLSGAREKIGLGSREGSRFLLDRVIERTGSSDRISSQYLLLARELALKTNGFPMMVPILPENERFAEEYIKRNSLGNGYAVFCPFTTRPQKHWFEERWAKLAARFREQSGLPAVILGGPDDINAAEHIQEISRVPLYNVTGQTSIKQAAAIIKRSSLVVGVDTGLTHMGYALQVPTIALFGATRPYLETDWMPGRVLYHPHECSPCRRNPTCEGNYTCMQAITTDEIMNVAAGFLEH